MVGALVRGEACRVVFRFRYCLERVDGSTFGWLGTYVKGSTTPSADRPERPQR